MAAPLREVRTWISAIEDGDFDEYLGPLMKALFTRKKILVGKAPATRGVEAPTATDEEIHSEPSIARRGLRPKRRRFIDDETVDQVAPSNTRKLLGNSNGPGAKTLDQNQKIAPHAVQNFGAAASDKKVYFEYGNKHYLRSDVMGKVFRLPPGFKPAVLIGYRVKVVGIGPQRLKVEFIDEPQQGMSYYEHVQNELPIYMPKGLLAPFLR